MPVEQRHWSAFGRLPRTASSIATPMESQHKVLIAAATAIWMAMHSAGGRPDETKHQENRAANCMNELCWINQCGGRTHEVSIFRAEPSYTLMIRRSFG